MVKHTKKQKRQAKNDISLSPTLIGLVGVAMVAAFFFGIQTSEDVRPVDLIHADDAVLAGDFDGDGVLTRNDVVIALELALEYRLPTNEELLADPNGDFSITSQDALTVLHLLP